MKLIVFNHSSSEKIYADYIKRIKRCTKQLGKEDCEDVLKEFNSHIYEGMKRNSEANEIENLLDVLQKLGTPEEVLKPLVAEKKLTQATRTFNPIHIFKALILNISNGVVYILFSLLYLFLFSFVFLIIAKLFNPTGVGLYYKENPFKFYLGILNSTEKLGLNEILGNLFIPLMIFLTLFSYFAITLLLRFKQKSRS